MLPDYDGNSILNLMSSLARACGGKTPYKTLKGLKIEDFKSKNIVLLEIDGMGAEFLEKNSKWLKKHKIKNITSVFPATTPAASITLVTGLPPSKLAMVSFYMLYKELGMVFAPLHYVPRIGGKIPDDVDPKELFKDIVPFSESIKRKSYTIMHTQPINSKFNAGFTKEKKMPFKTMNGMFKKIIQATKEKGNKYIYAYWGDLDIYQHIEGTKSKKTIAHFKRLERGIFGLTKKLKDTTLIVTADHGLTDIKKTIYLNDYPKIMECLTVLGPGGVRAHNCFVRPSKVKQFERETRKLKKYFDTYKGEDLIKKGWYGPGKPNSKLYDRVGDYVLIAKPHVGIRNLLINSKRKKGAHAQHSGVSKEEMLVPLIVIRK